MKIGIMSTCTIQPQAPEYQQLVDVTTPNNILYAQRYGYKPFMYTVTSAKGHPGFMKMADLKAICEEELALNGLDWIFWIDSDAIITNHTIQLQSFIDEDYDLIIGEDWNGINVGTFFLRVCSKSIEFLDSVVNFIPSDTDKQKYVKWWWESEQHAVYALQTVLKTKIVHHSLFNGYCIKPDINCNDWRGHVPGPQKHIPWETQLWKQGDFVLHAVSGNIPFKMNILQQALALIIT